MINSLLLIIYNWFRIAFGKLFHPGRYRVHWIQRISPKCALKVYDKGTLEIGRNCDMPPYCDLEVHRKGTLKIGNGCCFNRFVMISVQESVTIGDRCMIAPGVKIFDNSHQYNPENGVNQELTTAPISIGNGCWLCSNVVVLKGARIGNNCVIGAGCVVREDIPDGTVLTVRQEKTLRKGEAR